MRRRKIKRCFLLVLISTMPLFGCQNKDNQPIEQTTQSNTTATTQVSLADSHIGQLQSPLTGRWVKEEIAMQRPIAIMINNIKQAQPQSGIAKADIVYECLVEGGITRLMAIIQNYKGIEKLGSVRSARHYYVQIAEEYDAIFAHYGQTKYAVAEIEKRGVDTLSGLSSIGDQIYYRDSSRVAPHNAYINGEGIEKGIELHSYETKRSSQKQKFQFYKTTTTLKGEQASKVVLGYSNYTSPYFVYDEKRGVYDRFQYGEPQIDDLTGKQLAYQNVIVQFVDERDIDKNGYQTMDLTSSGTGYYMTKGSYIPITWEKKSDNGITKYYNEKGLEIRLNTGKTWISVFPNDRRQGVTFE